MSHPAAQGPVGLRWRLVRPSSAGQGPVLLWGDHLEQVNQSQAMLGQL